MPKGSCKDVTVESRKSTNKGKNRKKNKNQHNVKVEVKSKIAQKGTVCEIKKIIKIK